MHCSSFVNNVHSVLFIIHREEHYLVCSLILVITKGNAHEQKQNVVDFISGLSVMTQI